MNKARRHELKMLKYKKRLRNYKLLTCQKLLSPIGTEINGVAYNMTGFRSHGKPCSCAVCSPPDMTYKRAKEKSKLLNLIDFELNYNMGEMAWDEEKGYYDYCQPEYWRYG